MAMTGEPEEIGIRLGGKVVPVSAVISIGNRRSRMYLTEKANQLRAEIAALNTLQPPTPIVHTDKCVEEIRTGKLYTIQEMDTIPTYDFTPLTVWEKLTRWMRRTARTLRVLITPRALQS